MFITLKRPYQGRIKTKLGLMLHPRKGPIFLSIDVSWRRPMFIRHSPVTTDKKPNLRYKKGDEVMKVWRLVSPENFLGK